MNRKIMEAHSYYRRILSAAVALLFSISTLSQQAPQTPEELKAMLENIQKKTDSIQHVIKNRQNTGRPNTSLPAGPQAGSAIEDQTLPRLDTARIRSIPKKTFNLSELNTYLTDLYDQLCRRLPAEAVSSAKSIATKLGNHPAKLEAAALTAWQNGAGEEAVLLITKGGIEGGSDGLLLSNAGAMLDMYGLSEKAIPVLRTIVAYDPQNAIALNNLGQAFTALGLLDSAKHYFSRCLSLSPQHPEANNTAGLIELKKGNKTKAQEHFENSIRGGFNLSAYTALRPLLKDKYRIAHLIKPKAKLPEYFNQFKYKLPRQCLNVQEAATVKEEQQAFRKVIGEAIKVYQKMAKDAEKKFTPERIEQINRSNLEKARKGEPIMKPFQLLGGIMESELLLELKSDRENLQHFNTQNRRQYKELEEEYKRAYEALQKKYERDDDDECCGEGDISCCSDGEAFCRESNTLKNKYLELFAQLNEEWQSRNLQVERKHLDSLFYWSYFSAYDVDDYRRRFYIHAVTYLQTLSRLSEVKVLEPCQESEPGEAEKPEEKELKEFDCPVDVEIPFVVGKMTINCEKFSFKAGEGIIFKYEKKLTGGRQSTISIGAGAGIDAAWKLGGVKAGFATGMDMSVYFTFDKAGHCMDGGMMYKASRGVGIDFSAGERIKIKKNLGYMGDEIGWRFGISSGVSFTAPAPLKELPAQRPINKNVKIYQPK